MDAYDAEKAAKVWQRVLGEQPMQLGQRGLQALIMEALTGAATYLALSRRYQGNRAAQLRRMAEEEQAAAACLQGICLLTEGVRPAVKIVPPASHETAEAALRRCYRQSRQCLTDYESRTADPEYGPVYAHLAQRKRVHCYQILELLGGVPK